MNKLELIQTMRTTNGLLKREATEIVNLFFDQMAGALEKGDRVEIRGLYVYGYRTDTNIIPHCGNDSQWNNEEGWN